MKCSICGGCFRGIGNNPEPVQKLEKDGVDYSSDDVKPEDFNRCCDACNESIVIPARLKELQK